MQRLLAFGAPDRPASSSSRSPRPTSSQFDNIVGILLATAVNGVLALGVTFVIITGGIDLSVGTVMTLSAVMTGVFITDWQLPMPVGVAGRAGDRRAGRGWSTASLIAKMKIPPFIATLGMMNVAKGLSLVISRPASRSTSTTRPSSTSVAMGSWSGRVVPGFDVPNAVLILFWRGRGREPYPLQDGARPLHLCHGQQRRGDAALRRQRGRAGRSPSTRCAASSPGWPAC